MTICLRWNLDSSRLSQYSSQAKQATCWSEIAHELPLLEIFESQFENAESRDDLYHINVHRRRAFRAFIKFSSELLTSTSDICENFGKFYHRRSSLETSLLSRIFLKMKSYTVYCLMPFLRYNYQTLVSCNVGLFNSFPCNVLLIFLDTNVSGYSNIASAFYWNENKRIKSYCKLGICEWKDCESAPLTPKSFTPPAREEISTSLYLLKQLWSLGFHLHY